MQKDSRTGRGHWRGCHSFQNIICDGDSLNTTGSRDGGLMMGGKYWYYVRLSLCCSGCLVCAAAHTSPSSTDLTMILNITILRNLSPHSVHFSPARKSTSSTFRLNGSRLRNIVAVDRPAQLHLLFVLWTLRTGISSLEVPRRRRYHVELHRRPFRQSDTKFHENQFRINLR